MAIKLLDGRMLAGDLERDTVDLSVATGLIYFDVNTNTVNIGTEIPIADVQLQVAGTGSTILASGTALERPATQVAGMIRFNTDASGYEFWDGTEWMAVGNAYTDFVSTAYTDTTNLVYTLPSSQTTASVIVSINGVVQIPGTAYGVSGVTLTLITAPLVTDVIEVRTLNTTATVNSLTDGVLSITPAGTQHDVVGSLIPTVDITYDLGSLSNRWKDLYLSGTTINLGGIQLKNEASTFTVYEADGVTKASIDIDGGTYV